MFEHKQELLLLLQQAFYFFACNEKMDGKKNMLMVLLSNIWPVSRDKISTHGFGTTSEKLIQITTRNE